MNPRVSKGDLDKLLEVIAPYINADAARIIILDILKGSYREGIVSLILI